MPSSVGHDLVVGQRAAGAGELEAVAHLDALDGLDAHQGAGEPGVEPAVPVGVRAEPGRQARRRRPRRRRRGCRRPCGRRRSRRPSRRWCRRRSSAPGRRRAPRGRCAAGTTPAGARTVPSSTTCDTSVAPVVCSTNWAAISPSATRAAVSRALARSSIGRASSKPYFCMPTRSAWPGRGRVSGAPRLSPASDLGVDRVGRHDLLPLGPLAVADAQRDRAAERGAVADAADDLQVVGLEAHAGTASVAQATAGERSLDVLAGHAARPPAVLRGRRRVQGRAIHRRSANGACRRFSHGRTALPGRRPDRRTPRRADDRADHHVRPERETLRSTQPSRVNTRPPTAPSTNPPYAPVERLRGTERAQGQADDAGEPHVSVAERSAAEQPSDQVHEPERAEHRDVADERRDEDAPVVEQQPRPSTTSASVATYSGATNRNGSSRVRQSTYASQRADAGEQHPHRHELGRHAPGRQRRHRRRGAGEPPAPGAGRARARRTRSCRRRASGGSGSRPIDERPGGADDEPPPRAAISDGHAGQRESARVLRSAAGRVDAAARSSAPPGARPGGRAGRGR